VRSIRRAVADDAFLLARLNRFVQELHVERRPDQFRSPPPDELATWYRSRLGDPTTSCWIAEVGGAAVGYLLANHHRRPATPFAPAREWYEIDQLAVDPAHRRRGIGRALVESVIAAAGDQGLQTIETSSWAFNEEMHGLLERVGFTRKVIRFERTVSPAVR
jgi:GNAT superfamily N-acetyltransferase